MIRFLRAMSSSSTPGPIEKRIIEKIQKRFKPQHFTIANDSYKHSHHAAMRNSSNTVESHFRILIVSDEFAGKSLPMRHRMVYRELAEEMEGDKVHALQMKTKTVQEYQEN